MHTTIANPKTNFLLGASLDVLHQESKEWLDTIEFWLDEMKFFDKLLKNQPEGDEHKMTIREMLEHVEGIHVDFFRQLQEDVRQHERMLAIIKKNVPGASDEEYRVNHRRLKSRMDHLDKDFKSYKKVVFKFALD